MTRESGFEGVLREHAQKEELTDEQRLFNGLSTDDKLTRLNSLVQRSQIYSQIMLDNILENTLSKKRALEDTPVEAPKKKSRSSRKQKNTPKGDIVSLLQKEGLKEVSEKTRSTRNAIESAQSSHTQKQPALVSGGVMKGYQLDGLEWMSTLYENGLNGILADEMGLGKTLQCIAFLSYLMENGVRGPFLVVVPLTTLSNWENEFTKFTPDIKVVKYIGTKQQRLRMNLTQLCRKNNVILTSYEMSIRDFRKFDLIADWKFLIVDEGHRLKNSECLLIKILKKLKVSNRLLITGTPLQNNLNELWSLLNFILPDIFHDLELFQQWFNFDELTNLQQELTDTEEKKIIELNIQKNLISNLHTIIKPFLLRRLKKDVIKNLPPKKEYLIHIPLTDLQKKLYQDALDNKLFSSLVECNLKEHLSYNHRDLFNDANDFKVIDKFLMDSFGFSLSSSKQRAANGRSLKEAESDDEFEVVEILDDEVEEQEPLEEVDFQTLDRHGKQKHTMNRIFPMVYRNTQNQKLQNVVMQLRNICSSPYVYYEPFPISREGKYDNEFMEVLLKNTSKIKILDQLLKELLPKNHKVLIFSQFTKMLDILQDWLVHQGIEICRLDGETPQDTREEQIRDFGDPKKKKQVFLLSTRSGGLGINLTASDTVILFDNDWNPQMDLQAIDRVHRIGQTKPVKIFRFITTDSVEELLISKSYSKRFLEKLIILMGEFKFNKFKKLIDNDDALEGTNLNQFLEISKRFKINGAGEGKVDQKTRLNQHLYLNDSESVEILTKEEVNELMDRSAECYANENTFDNITAFETTNNMDESV